MTGAWVQRRWARRRRSINVYDVVGLGGVAVLLAAYALTVSGSLDARGATALALNALGPCLILVSLRDHFNLAAAIVEAAWAVIALTGLARLAVSWRSASGNIHRRND